MGLGMENEGRFSRSNVAIGLLGIVLVGGSLLGIADSIRNPSPKPNNPLMPNTGLTAPVPTTEAAATQDPRATDPGFIHNPASNTYYRRTGDLEGRGRLCVQLWPYVEPTKDDPIGDKQTAYGAASLLGSNPGLLLDPEGPYHGDVYRFPDGVKIGSFNTGDGSISQFRTVAPFTIFCGNTVVNVR